MEYKLALRLKVNGFPQTKHDDDYYDSDTDEMVSNPTEEELVDEWVKAQ